MTLTQQAIVDSKLGILGTMGQIRRKEADQAEAALYYQHRRYCPGSAAQASTAQ